MNTLSSDIAKRARIWPTGLSEIEASLELIRLQPRLYPVSTQNTRRRILRSFPYSMIYQERDEMILIIALAHAKRREGYWTQRLKQ